MDLNTSHRTALNVMLGLVFVIGLGLTAYLIADSWGGLYWLFDCAVGAVTGLLALLRAPQRIQPSAGDLATGPRIRPVAAGLATGPRIWPVAAGLATAAVAVVVAWIADLPQEPGPVTALALAVLVGSGIRTLPGPAAAAVAAGGFMVVVGTWLTAIPDAAGFTVVTIVNTLTWLGAIVLGITMRAAGRTS